MDTLLDLAPEVLAGKYSTMFLRATAGALPPIVLFCSCLTFNRRYIGGTTCTVGAKQQLSCSVKVALRNSVNRDINDSIYSLFSDFFIFS